MTEAEELELLELEEEDAKSKAAAARASARAPEVATDAEPSIVDTILRSAAQGATGGFGDEILGGLHGSVKAAAEYLPESIGGTEKSRRKGFLQLYREARDADRRGNARAEAAHGNIYTAGNLAGGLVAAPLTATAAPAATLGQAMRAGALMGGGLGLGAGLGQSTGDLTRGTLEEANRAAGDMAMGGAGGALLGGALPVVGAGARKASDILRVARAGGYVKPTPEAQRLLSEGVDLTLGQMNPSAALGRFEEAAANKGTGNSISTMRQNSAGSARDILLRKAGAPGAQPPTAGAPVSQQLEEIASGFTAAYDDALGGARLQPDQYLGQGKWRGLLTDKSIKGSAVRKGAFELAAESPGIDASDAVRKRALKVLENEATILSPTKSGPNTGTVDARQIQTLRSNLKTRIRNLGEEGEDRQLGEIYQKAVDFTTELLEGQLPPANAAKLRAVDASYRNRLAVEKAAQTSAAHRVEGQFTPVQLLEAIRQKGSTPALKTLAHDADKVLSAKFPLTGALGTMQEIAPGGKFFGPAWAHFTNTIPSLKAHALGAGSLPLPVGGPLAIAHGAAHMADASSSNAARDALIRALTRQRSPALPLGAFAEEQQP